MEVIPAGSPLAEIMDALRARPAPPIGPNGAPDAQVQRRLDETDATALLGSAPVVDRRMADAVKSGLYNYNNCLEQAHTIAQAIETPTGSYWHGIMHRREPDYSNGKYWFRCTGAHPIYPRLRAAALELLARQGSPAAQQILQQIESKPDWDALAMVDWCEQAASSAELSSVLEAIQRREIELLLEYSVQQATGRA